MDKWKSSFEAREGECKSWEKARLGDHPTLEGFSVHTKNFDHWERVEIERLINTTGHADSTYSRGAVYPSSPVSKNWTREKKFVTYTLYQPTHLYNYNVLINKREYWAFVNIKILKVYNHLWSCLFFVFCFGVFFFLSAIVHSVALAPWAGSCADESEWMEMDWHRFTRSISTFKK